MFSLFFCVDTDDAAKHVARLARIVYIIRSTCINTQCSYKQRERLLFFFFSSFLLFFFSSFPPPTRCAQILVLPALLDDSSFTRIKPLGSFLYVKGPCFENEPTLLMTWHVKDDSNLVVMFPPSNSVGLYPCSSQLRLLLNVYKKFER